MVIFCGHKIHNYRRTNRTVGTFQALKKFFTNDPSLDEPFVMERISMIDADFELKKIHLEVQNENGLDTCWEDKDDSDNHPGEHAEVHEVISANPNDPSVSPNSFERYIENSSYSPSLRHGLYVIREDDGQVNDENASGIDFYCSSFDYESRSEIIEDPDPPKKRKYYNVDMNKAHI